MKRILLVLAVVAVGMAAAAQSIEKDNVTYVLNEEDMTAEVRTSLYQTYTDVNIPDSVYDEQGRAYAVTSIGDNAFVWATIKGKLTMPNTVTTIGEKMLRSASINEIQLSENINSLGEFFLHSATELKKIHFPASIEIVGGSILAGSSIREISIAPNSKHMSLTEDGGLLWTEEGDGTFYLFHPTDSEPTTFEGVDIIYSYCFCNNQALKSLVIPGNIKYVLSWAFYYCKNLEKVVMEEGMETIGYEAFLSCDKLKEVSLPSSITEILDDAFKETSLEKIVCHSATPPAASDEAFTYKIYKTCEVTVPKGSLDAYRNDYTWGLFKNIVEEGTTAVEGIAPSAPEKQEPIYDLRGMRLKEAKRGIYIKGEKKVVR